MHGAGGSGPSRPVFRIGDRFDRGGTELRLTGLFIDKPQETGTGRLDVDHSTEYARLESSLGSEFVSLRFLSPEMVTATGPSPLDGVARAYEVDDELRDRFDAALQPRDDEPAISPGLFEEADDRGGTVLVAGGAVRDVLRGDRERKDLDLAGTMLPFGFRRLVYDLQITAAGGEPERLNTSYQMTLAKNLPVVKVRRERGDPAFEYGSLTLAWEPVSLGWQPHGGPPPPTHLLGTSFRVDADWRDLTVNTLLYDPCKGVIYDPTGYGLGDLGLDGPSLTGRSNRLEPRSLNLRPLELPESMPAAMVVKRVARLVRQILTYSTRGADLGLVDDWCHRHTIRLVHALAGEGPGPDHPFTAELRSQLSDQGIAQVRGGGVALRERFGPELWNVVAPLLPAEPPTLGPGGPELPRLLGSAVASLAHVNGQWKIERVDGPGESTPRAVQRYFGRRFAGYQHTVLSVAVGGREVDDVLALSPPYGEGTWYVELDPSSQMINVTEHELDVIRQKDRR